MDVANGIIVLGSLTAIVLFVLATAGWGIKRWIKEQFADNVSQLLPNLLNGDTPVAVYAHQARDAANEAKDAAIDAKTSSRQVREIAGNLQDAVQEIVTSHKAIRVTLDEMACAHKKYTRSCN